MATTIFPETDDVATVAAWAAMIAALDRGDTTEISGMVDSANTNRAIFQSLASGTASADATTPREWVPDLAISIGEAWIFEMNLSISKSVIDAGNDDDLLLKITVPAGVTAHGTIQTISRTDTGLPTAKFHNSWFFSGSTTQALSVDIANESPQNLAVLVTCIVIGDSAAGSIEIDYLKNDIQYSTEYTSGQSYISGRRILG